MPAWYQGDGRSAAHEMARERPGWSVEAWVKRLAHLRRTCAKYNPARSAELRAALKILLESKP